MVHDTLDRIALYRPLSAHLARAIDWILATDLHALPADGVRQPIHGDDVTIAVTSYTTKLPQAQVFETHRQYIDIQIVLRGQEHIDVTPLRDDLTITMRHDDAKDAQLYAKDARGVTTLHMQPDTFAIFFPHDAHSPNQAIDGKPTSVTKAVLKVRV